MTRLIAVALLLLVSGTAFADWTSVAVGGTDGDELIFYGDLATLKKSGSMAKMWVMLNYDRQQDYFNDGSRVRSVKSLFEFDCDNDSSRDLASNYYVGPMGGGNVIFTKHTPSTWTPQGPGSLGLALLRTACSSPQKSIVATKGNPAERAPVFVPAPGGHTSGENWRYWRMTDPEYGVEIAVASTESVGYRGTLMIRRTPDGGRSAMIGVPGAIVCAEPCKIKAEVDGVTSERDARPPGRMTNMMYFTRETLPASMVTTSHRIDIEINLGEDGWRVLTFRTDGFDWSRMK